MEISSNLKLIIIFSWKTFKQVFFLKKINRIRGVVFSLASHLIYTCFIPSHCWDLQTGVSSFKQFLIFIISVISSYLISVFSNYSLIVVSFLSCCFFVLHQEQVSDLYRLWKESGVWSFNEKDEFSFYKFNDSESWTLNSLC